MRFEGKLSSKFAVHTYVQNVEAHATSLNYCEPQRSAATFDGNENYICSSLPTSFQSSWVSPLFDPSSAFCCCCGGDCQQD
mmetsp:Transcript_23122/g.32318  ORF Transcript_23122/g.32318 Transcript_23122/m.32318 type:complete len:81 (+) Transcript_23122:210-452(+)